MTVIIEITGVFPELIAVKLLMPPFPLAGIPMVGLELVHLKVVFPPVLLVENVMGDETEPLQSSTLDTGLTWAAGFTVMVKDDEFPEHVTTPSVKDGVTVIMASNGEVPALESK